MKLGDWLLGKGRITQEQLARALQDHAFFGGRLGTSLIKLGYLDEDTLGEYLADISHARYASPEKLDDIQPEVIATVPSRLAARYRIVPIAIQGRKLHLAMRDPKDLIALDEIAFLTGLTIEPYVATEFRIVRAIERYYGLTLGTRTIPVSGAGKNPTAAPPKGPAAAPPPAPGPAKAEMGLDGLPIHANPDEGDEPFVGMGVGGSPPQDLDDEPIPASLDEWRMAQEDIPDEIPTPAASEARPPVAPSPASAPTPLPAPAAAAPQGPIVPAPVPFPAASIEAVATRLRAAETRDEVFNAILEFTSVRFRRAAMFVVQQDRVLGWSGRGDGLAPTRIRNVTVPLDRPSLFVFFRSGGDYYYGPVPDLPANARFYLDLGCPPPSRVLLLPLTIKERPAVILYADTGSDASKAPDIQLFRRLLAKGALALEVLILKNKIMMI